MIGFQITYLFGNIFLTKIKLNDVTDILEIGSFEGMSALFLLKNFENSKIDCVETFKGSDEHGDISFKK